MDLPSLRIKNNDKKLLTNINNKIQNKEFNIIDSNKKDSTKKVKININNNTLMNSSRVKVSNNINIDNSKEDNNEGNQIILGTPTDSEFPLVLSQKRTYNTKQSFFFESLNKIKELTKQEKIKTFQKEFTSQILK